MHAVVCPDCGENAEKVGPIPSGYIFAGNMLQSPISGGHLYRCKCCFLAFRWPRLKKTNLDDLYKTGNIDNWTSYASARTDWAIAKKYINELLNYKGSILDIGCFDGQFLATLGNKFLIFGIEIHEGASQAASAKGVSVVASNFSELSGCYDFITAFDVIEHTESPMQFLSQCLDIVKPGGYLLISSGNYDSMTFLMMRNQYWYCAIPEHISFISPKWLSYFESRLKFEIIRINFFSHHDGSLSLKIKELILNLINWISPSLISQLRKIGFGKSKIINYLQFTGTPPYWITAKDHFLILLRKL